MEVGGSVGGLRPRCCGAQRRQPRAARHTGKVHQRTLTPVTALHGHAPAPRTAAAGGSSAAEKQGRRGAPCRALATLGSLAGDAAGGGIGYAEPFSARAAPETVSFRGSTLLELQALVHACVGVPTIIDLGGSSLELVGPPPAGTAVSAAAGLDDDACRVDSGMQDGLGGQGGIELAELLAGGACADYFYSRRDPAAGVLDLCADGLTLQNGRLLLRGDATVRITARNVSLSNVVIINDEGPDIWTTDPSAYLDNPPKPLLSVGSGTLAMESCIIACMNKARHLLQSGAEDFVSLSYSRLSGGCYACVAMPGAQLRIEFCQLIDYGRIGLMASGATVDILATLFRPSPASRAAVAVTVDEGGQVHCTGCFVEGAHEADTMCTDGSRMELLGCKLGDAQSRSETAVFLGHKGRAVLRDCDLANAASVRGGRLALHGCNLALAGAECAGTVLQDSILTVEGCRSGNDGPVHFRAAKRSAVIISNSPQVLMSRMAD